MSTSPAEVSELMAVCAAREIRDGDLVFVGVGTSGRAFSLAVGIPLIAVRLAQMQQAPSAAVFWGGLLEPRLSEIPDTLRQDSITHWHAAAATDTSLKCDMLARGCFDVSFESAAQVDRFGNLNITAIGHYDAPQTRLVGCLAQPEHLAFVRRPIVLVDLKSRTFVERVDFVTSVGNRRDGRTRSELGLAPGGPHLVITDKAVFDFSPTSGEMRLKSVHPGATVAEVTEHMTFHPIVPRRVDHTPPPSGEELHAIRHVIDPKNVLLRR